MRFISYDDELVLDIRVIHGYFKLERHWND